MLLGCPGRPLPHLIAAQLAADGDGTADANEVLAGAVVEVARSDAPAGALLERMQARWEAVLATMPEPTRAEAAGYVAAMTRRLPALLAQPYLRDLCSFDPDPVLRRISCPTLALWGEYDQGRKLPNASAWQVARALAEGTSAAFRIVQVPAVNHFLQPCATGAMNEFARIEETIAPDVLRAVVEWSTRWRD